MTNILKWHSNQTAFQASTAMICSKTIKIKCECHTWKHRSHITFLFLYYFFGYVFHFFLFFLFFAFHMGMSFQCNFLRDHFFFAGTVILNRQFSGIRSFGSWLLNEDGIQNAQMIWPLIKGKKNNNNNGSFVGCNLSHLFGWLFN